MCLSVRSCLLTHGGADNSLVVGTLVLLEQEGIGVSGKLDAQVKNQEDIRENEAQLGTVDITEGVNDLNKIEVKEQVIAEPVVDDEL